MERFFGETGSVALLVKPLSFGPAEAAFFVQGFAAPGPHFSVLVAPAPVRVPSPIRISGRSPANTIEVPMGSEARPSWLRTAGTGLAVVGAAIGFLSLIPAPKAAAGHLGLQAFAVADQQVRIQWDHDSAGIRSARKAMLEILDGGSRHTLPLTAEQLRGSGLTYRRQSDAIEVRMKLPGGAQEVARVAPPPPAPLPAEAAKPSPLVTPPPPAAQTQFAVTPVGSASRMERPPLKQFRPVVERAEAGARDLELPDLPPATSVTLPAVAALKIPLGSVPSAALPTAVRTARSGRLIWTGWLGRHEVVDIEGSRPSVGSLSGGALPGRSARLVALPAEYKKDVLYVYVPDAGRHNRTEAPGPSTGWNRLHFIWDPERLKQISVVQPPAAANQFDRLVLRNEGRSCSVIVLEWRVD
jgi:hypothetical protein